MKSQPGNGLALFHAYRIKPLTEQDHPLGHRPSVMEQPHEVATGSVLSPV